MSSREPSEILRSTQILDQISYNLSLSDSQQLPSFNTKLNVSVKAYSAMSRKLTFNLESGEGWAEEKEQPASVANLPESKPQSQIYK